MSSLNEEIAAWKSRFSRRRACSRDELEELESHLREEIDVLVGKGISESEAFDQAVMQMGAAEQINNEFAKEQTLLPADRAVLYFSIASAGILCIAVPLLVVPKAMDKSTILAIHVATITLGYLGAFLLAITGTYSTIRRLASARNEVSWLEVYSILCRRAAIGGLILVSAGLLTGGIWSKDNLGTFWNWNLKEVGGICVLLWYVATLFWLSFRSEHPKWVPSLTISGGLICVFAWFGANGLATAPFFIVIVVAHIVTLGIALRIFCDRTRLVHSADYRKH